jgi:DNA-binding CsgD family transcriptional regulator
MQYYLQNGYPLLGAFENNNDFRLKEYVVWDALCDNDPIVIYSRQLFNIKHGITIVKKVHNGFDFFNFGVSEEPRNIIEHLLKERENLDRFINEFYVKAKKSIIMSENRAFNLNDFNSLKVNKQNESKLYLGPKYDYAYLTVKEIICLKHLLQGLSIPRIADKEHLSARTVEKHIENIKQKLHCNTQFELGYLAAKLEIDLL